MSETVAYNPLQAKDFSEVLDILEILSPNLHIPEKNP